MALAQVRAFNPRGVVPVRGGDPREAPQRSIRGYDAAGALLFRIPASKVGRPSARQAIDAKSVRERQATHGGRLARVEIDALSGSASEFLVTAGGEMRTGYRIDGRLVAAFS